jgi:hypothetical protein
MSSPRLSNDAPHQVSSKDLRLAARDVVFGLRKTAIDVSRAALNLRPLQYFAEKRRFAVDTCRQGGSVNNRPALR